MSAHHLKHALSCPANGNGRLADCECDAPGAAKARERANKQKTGSPTAITPAELLDAVEKLGLDEEDRPRRAPAPGNYLTSPYEGDDGQHPSCAACEGKDHHWSPFDPDVRYLEGDGDFYCHHCEATCPALAGVMLDGQPVPNEGDVRLPNDDTAMSLVDRRLRKISALIGEMTGYRVSLQVEVDSMAAVFDLASAAVIVHQICRGCRDAVQGRMSGGGTRLELLANAGIAARKARLLHKCQPPKANYDLLSADELEALGQDLDREGSLMVLFAQTVEQMAAAKRLVERNAKKGSPS